MSTPIANFMVGEWAFVKDHSMSEIPMRITPEHYVMPLCEFREIPLNPQTLLKSGFASFAEDCYSLEIVAGDGYTSITLCDLYDGVWDINAITANKLNGEVITVIENNVFLKVNHLQRIAKQLGLNMEIEYVEDWKRVKA